MKKRLTALLLSFAMAFAIGAPSAMADGASEAAEPAAQMRRAAAVSEVDTAAQTQSVTTPAQSVTAADETEPETPEDVETQETAEPEPDEEGTLSFENLRPRMLAGSYRLRALQESIDDIESHDYDWRYKDLRLSMNELATAQWMLIALLHENGSAAAFNTQYDQMRKEFEDIEKGEKQKDDQTTLWQYRNAQNQAVIAGEALYLTLKDFEAQDAALGRTIAQLERTEREMQLRCELGQVSRLDVEKVSTGRMQAVSGRKTLEMGYDAALLQLKSLVGAELDAELSLGALPQVTAQERESMDLETDLAKAMAASYALFDAKKQLDDFRKDVYDKVIDNYGSNEKRFEVSEAKHALQAYQYNYENTLLTYELNFRTLYAQVKDAAQVLSAKRAALAEQEKSYAVSALKYEQGNISANAFADAKDELSSAKDDVAKAERELFSTYRTYTWAVDYGILNA